MKTSFLVLISVLLITGCGSVEKPEPEDDWYIPGYRNSVYAARSKLRTNPDTAPQIYQQWRRDLYSDYKRFCVLTGLPFDGSVLDGTWSSDPIAQYEAISLLAFIKDQRIPFQPGPVLIATIYICDETSGDDEGSCVRLFDWIDGFFPKLHEQLSYETKWSIVYTKVRATKPEFFSDYIDVVHEELWESIQAEQQ